MIILEILENFKYFIGLIVTIRMINFKFFILTIVISINQFDATRELISNDLINQIRLSDNIKNLYKINNVKLSNGSLNSNFGHRFSSHVSSHHKDALEKLWYFLDKLNDTLYNRTLINKTDKFRY